MPCPDRRYLRGLRLNEALTLSRDIDAEDVISVDMSGKYPMFAIPSDVDKSRKQRLLPMAPEFAHLLEAIPDDERTGNVFCLEFKRTHEKETRSDTVGKQICKVGRKAGIKVSASTYASAHDLRRSFGTRWADKVKPHILMQLMRHDDIKTTMEFYVQSDADEVAEAVWRTAATDTLTDTSVSSYWFTSKNITPGEIRTHDLRIRNPTLYPAELRGQPMKTLGIEGV